MGAFFSNVQVRLHDRPRADLIAAIREAAGEADEVEADGEPDRTVLVLPPDAHGWVAIYDEVEAPEELAARVSQAMGTHAAAVSVHDSDLLLLSLYAKGERIDRYDSNPGASRQRVSEKKAAELAGSPARWAPLLIDGDEAALAEALASAAPIVERKLRKVAKLVGWEHANTGYRYASAEGEVLPEGTITLRFRARARPEAPTGLPAFLLDSPMGSQKELPFAVGTSMTLHAAFRNEGGAGRGLSVIAWGSALEQGLVSVEAVEVAVGGDRRAGLSPAARASALGGRLMVAEVADLAFGSVMVGPGGSKIVGPATPDAVRKHTDAHLRARVHVTLEGRVLKEGRGELFCGVLPDENDAGSDAHAFRLVIAPTIAAMLEGARRGRTTKKLKS